jgi:hypothetical protein
MFDAFLCPLVCLCSGLTLALLLVACGDSDSPVVGENDGLDSVLAELRDSRELLLEVLEDTVRIADQEAAATTASREDGIERPMSVLPVVAAPPQPAAWPAGIPLTPARTGALSARHR